MKVYKLVNAIDDVWYSDYVDFDMVRGELLCGYDVDVFVADIQGEQIREPQGILDSSLFDDIDETIDWKYYKHYSA